MKIDKVFRSAVYKQLAALPEKYKDHFVNRGVKLPLQTVPYFVNGLLSQLPAAHNRTGWPWNIEVNSSVYQLKTTWPKLSITIPSYNQGEFLEEAIRSVLLQNYPNVELIIIDGDSNDKSKQILKQYAPWLSYWQSEPDNGQGHAINLGFSIASGNYYGWLNSDDFYNEKALYHLGTEIMKSGKSFYYGDATIVNKDSAVNCYWNAFLVKDMFLRFAGIIASHSAFWESSIHKPIWEAMNCNVDGELWIRLVKGQTKKHIKYPLGAFRIYDDTKSSHDKWKAKWLEDDLNIERVHGSPPKLRSVLAYAYRFTQKIYKKL